MSLDMGQAITKNTFKVGHGSGYTPSEGCSISTLPCPFNFIKNKKGDYYV